MPTIGVAVSTETKDRFDAATSERRTTASRLAAWLIGEFLRRQAERPADAVDIVPALVGGGSQPVGGRTEQVFVRLDPHHFDVLGRLAAERHWYRGTYLANLFQAHAGRRPVLCELEINAVRQVARQLADMGRNINQIAKKLNASDERRDLALAADFDVIRMLIDLETTTVKDLIKANMRGWGVGDGQA